MQEPTITQNSALYLVQHRVRRRNQVLKWMRAAERDQTPEIRLPTFSEASLVPRFYQSNAR